MTSNVQIDGHAVARRLALRVGELEHENAMQAELIEQLLRQQAAAEEDTDVAD